MEGRTASTSNDTVNTLAQLPTSSPSRSKRIIMFCDGTGRDGSAMDTNRDTNVWRLYRIIEHATCGPEDIEQVLLWVPGIGMDPGDHKFWDGMLASRIRLKVRRAYELILSTYNEGDEIVLVGFSRGAFIVRAVASIIGSIGLSKSAPLDSLFHAFDQLPGWVTEKDAKRKPSKKVVEARKVLSEWRPENDGPRIRALAIFDTVGAIGFPSYTHQPSYHFFGQSATEVGPHVDYVFHALALDDTRPPFLPTRVTLTEEGKRLGQEERFEEVWFGGWHADVGGGWDTHELASICLIWMAAHLKKHSLVRFDEASLLEIPGIYLDHKKSPSPSPTPAPTPLSTTESLEVAVKLVVERSFARISHPTKPWGEGMTWDDLFPFVKRMPKWPRPTLREGDKVHPSAFATSQVAWRTARLPKLQKVLDGMVGAELEELEVKGKECWPGLGEVSGVVPL